MNNKEKQLSELLKQDEFSIYDFIIIIKSLIFKSQKILLYIFSLFFLISIIGFNIQEKLYESKASVLINQSSSNKTNSGISSLLGIASVDIPKTNIFGPEMFKEIVQSKAFLNNLVESQIPIEKSGRNKATVEHYLLTSKKSTIREKVINIFKERDNKKINLRLSSNLNDTNNYIKKSVTPELIFSNKVPPIVELDFTRNESINEIKNKIKIENKGNTTTVTVTINDPFISAVLSKLVLETLIDYITLYKTTKERDNIKYLQERLSDSEKNYQDALMKFANYKDQNYGIIFQSWQTKEQVYSNDINLKFTLYNQFKTQLEQAKIDLNKETPIFTVLDTISIPTETSNQNYLLYSIKYLALAFVSSLIILLYKLLINN